jgi:TolA-binding protein
MMEPRRLLEQGATDVERLLLDSARADAPEAGAAQRTLVALAALAAGSGAPGLPGAPAAAHAVKLGVLAKAGLAALIGVGVLGAGALVHRLADQRALVPSASLPPLREAANAPHRQAAPADESLGAEIRVLDIARAAVDARKPAVAERALDTYAQRFPQGHLKPEASVLGLAVLVQQGKREAAKALAARLLASRQYEAYQYRIRSLLREAGE